MLTRHPNELSVHPALRGLPELDDADPLFLAGIDSVAEHGLFDAIKIDDKDQIVDGRHRNRWARKAGLKEVEVKVIADDEVQAVILESLLARRHYGDGARAYMALPLLAEAAAAGKARRAGNLKKGLRSPNADGNGNREKSGIEALAERLGVSRDLLEMARRVAAIFAKQQEVIDAWLESVESDQAREIWSGWDQERPDAWTAFRAHWLKGQAACAEQDPTYEALPLPPENWKEEFEAKLYAGDIKLGGIVQALAGRVATRGKGRADLKAREVHELLNLAQKRIKNLTSAWNKWDALEAEDRMQTLSVLTAECQNWPKDVRAALKRTL